MHDTECMLQNAILNFARHSTGSNDYAKSACTYHHVLCLDLKCHSYIHSPICKRLVKSTSRRELDAAQCTEVKATDSLLDSILLGSGRSLYAHRICSLCVSLRSEVDPGDDFFVVEAACSSFGGMQATRCALW